MAPIISIVGKSNSGKTTIVEKLVSELTKRGYRVATTKHTPRGMDIDKPDTDSWRHVAAGSINTVINSPDRVILIRPVTEALNINEISRLIGEDCDIIIAEGLKQDTATKIEVHRKEIGVPLEGISKLIAIATDEPLETGTQQFALDDIEGMADLIESGFIKPQMERISLYVNGEEVPLSVFPREIITNIVLALGTSMKGVDEIKSLDISLRKTL
ncbi:molybdopterin-guanine dinucleotide biosynthesis protein B [Chloroflexota bacterium]